MSVRSSIFYGIASDGSHWHVWHHSEDGVFIEVNKPVGPEDCWGYEDLEVTPWEGDQPGAEVKMHLPIEVCAAIATYYESVRVRHGRK